MSGNGINGHKDEWKKVNEQLKKSERWLKVALIVIAIGGVLQLAGVVMRSCAPEQAQQTQTQEK